MLISKNNLEFSLSFLKNYLIKLIVKHPMRLTQLSSKLLDFQYSSSNHFNLLITKFLKELILIDNKKNFEIQIEINHAFDLFLRIKAVISDKILFNDIELLFHFYCHTLSEEYLNVALSKPLAEVSKNFNYDKIQDIISPSKHTSFECLRNLREKYSEVRKLKDKEMIKFINKQVKNNPVLSVVDSLWNVGILLEKDQFEKAEKILISYFNKNDLEYTFLFILYGTFMPLLH